MLYDVLIIGGGIVGCAVARELSRYDLHVALCERTAEVGFGTTKSNSGIIHGGHHADPTTLKGKLEWAGNQLWDGLCTELGFGFQRVGELTVATQETQFPVLDKLMRHGAAQGIPGMAVWSRERILQEEPALSPDVLSAVFAPLTGVVNPYEACYGLAESALRNGLALFLNAPVTALTRNGDQWAVKTPGADLAARFVVNAAGLYADGVADLAGVRTFTIHPRKGEEYLLDKRLHGLVKHVIFPCPSPVSKGILVIPTYDGTIMVGPTAHDTPDKEEFTTSAVGCDEIFAAAQRIVPGVSERDVIAQFAGLRAAVEGDEFIIGPTTQRGFINAAGIQSPGLTAAPAIANLLCDILRDEGLVLRERQDFVAGLPKPVHFHTLPTDDQMALVARDARYRRIACRCEFVTEGEVLDAIDRGACTVDGVKFRTRAGMGRCQGGFCTSRVMELLARSQDAPLTAVTKRGPGTWLVCERECTP